MARFVIGIDLGGTNVRAALIAREGEQEGQVVRQERRPSLASESASATVTQMAELMQTSRAQVNRLLDPDNGGATIESLQRAAHVVGRQLRLELI